jgi:hypothetical protein
MMLTVLTSIHITGERSVSVKSTQYMRLERHKEPYNTALQTRKRGMWQLEW